MLRILSCFLSFSWTYVDKEGIDSGNNLALRGDYYISNTTTNKVIGVLEWNSGGMVFVSNA
jgi:hypothetical protein